MKRSERNQNFVKEWCRPKLNILVCGKVNIFYLLPLFALKSSLSFYEESYISKGGL